MSGSRWWAAVAAAVATACGQAHEVVATQASNPGEQRLEDLTCEVCVVEGQGLVTHAGHALSFAVDATPTGGPGPSGGAAAAGHVVLAEVTEQPAGQGLHVAGAVDAVRGCARVGGVLSAELSGQLAGGGAFGIVVTDGGAVADDAIALAGSTAVPTVRVTTGDIRIHGLGHCHAACGEGTCWCDESQLCEPCTPHAHPAPPPLPPPPAPPLQP